MFEAKRIIFICYRQDRVGKRLRLVFQERQQQPRADAVIVRHVIHDLGAGAVGIGDIGGVILEPAGMRIDKGFDIEADLGRTIDEQAVGDDLVGRAPERQVIDRDFHRHARRHGGGIRRDERVGFQDFFDRGVETQRQSGQGVAGLGGVIDQLAGSVARPAGERLHGCVLWSDAGRQRGLGRVCGQVRIWIWTR